MPQFRVDSEELLRASGAVSTSVSSIRDSVSGMYVNLGNLQEMWTGSAAANFTAVAEQWRAAQLQMEEALEGIQRALAQASGLYSEAEAQASGLFAG
ncbi:WXG100 family type VII secretion target [Bifidobacterium favimelis]|uniref:ESAT-6-like protein n=1 Tax=Bifidobacterium favimelis TaxID=3122979 RepID=A0ABU8ZNA7_9BIFI